MFIMYKLHLIVQLLVSQQRGPLNFHTHSPAQNKRDANIAVGDTNVMKCRFSRKDCMFSWGDDMKH